MQFAEYQQHLAALKYGKRLPTAIYVFREADTDFGPELNQLLSILAIQHGLDAKFNVIKFRTDELKVSFLCYPDFLREAHPALRHAVTVDLVTGRARHTDYAGNHNPPILHRKETFLPSTHPLLAEFAALTRAEEAEGLYAHPATIGFKLNWERLLQERGLFSQAHELKRKSKPQRHGGIEAQTQGQEDRRWKMEDGGTGGKPQRHGDTEAQTRGDEDGRSKMEDGGMGGKPQRHGDTEAQTRGEEDRGSKMEDGGTGGEPQRHGGTEAQTQGDEDGRLKMEDGCVGRVPSRGVPALRPPASDLRPLPSDLCSPTSDLRPPPPCPPLCLCGSVVGPVIERHKTAMTRYDLSKPVKTLLEYGMLKAGGTFFDYGCGQGSDVRGLQALGHAAEGWDPVHRPEVPRREADIVNLGYVLNVIEDPAERLEALVDAYRHARRLLVVSALINETVAIERATQYGDGIVTRRNTFQKFFEQSELQQYLEDALDTTAVPVALGVFYVFRDPAEQQDFLSARSRRAIDWTQISARLGLGGPRTMWQALYDAHRELLDGFGKVALVLGRFPAQTEFDRLPQVDEQLGSAKRALRAYIQGGAPEGLDWEEIRVRFGIGQPPKRRWELLYEENRELLDAYWKQMLQLGRLPEPEEYPQTAELREKIGSPKVALRMFLQKGGGDEVKRAAENRKRDLLVYVALANLRKKVLFGHLSPSLRFDIREFFGNYTVALQQGMELLYAAGDPGEIELACEELQVGWQDEQALYIHRSLLDQLPPVLRAYVGCATALFGDVSQTDVIKLHKASGKVTFLGYDDFEGKPLPELRNRIKVNLRTRWVQVFPVWLASQDADKFLTTGTNETNFADLAECGVHFSPQTLSPADQKQILGTTIHQKFKKAEAALRLGGKVQTGMARQFWKDEGK